MTFSKASDVGFVVIGRNEGERLKTSLQSVLSICSNVIYVDSSSDDDSVEIAAALGVRIVKLSSRDFLTAASGRTAGFQELRRSFPDCEYVHFIDGDCVLQPMWLGTALEFISRNERAAAVCGARFEEHPSDSIYNTILNDEWKTPAGIATSCGGDALMRVSALEEVGPFRAELKSCEEPELCARFRAAGWQIWRLDIPMTQHDAAMFSLSQWWKRGARAGFGYVQVWRLPSPSGERLFNRELASTLAWAVAVPCLAIIAILFTHSLLPVGIVLFLYAFQLSRMAAEKDFRAKASWQRAILFLVGKFAAASGVALCLFGLHQQQTSYR